MTRDRALAILAAFGAEPARWPAAERAALAALARQDPDVAAALARARALDTAIARWLARPGPRPVMDDATAARAALRQARADGDGLAGMRPAPRWRGLAAAAAIAALLAGVAGLAGLGVPSRDAAPEPAAPHLVAATVPPDRARTAVREEDGLFALMFTPTLEEERL